MFLFVVFCVRQLNSVTSFQKTKNNVSKGLENRRKNYFYHSNTLCHHNCAKIKNQNQKKNNNFLRIRNKGPKNIWLIISNLKSYFPTFFFFLLSSLHNETVSSFWDICLADTLNQQQQQQQQHSNNNRQANRNFVQKKKFT